MTPQIYIGLPKIERVSYLNKAQHNIIDVVCKVLDIPLDEFNSASRLSHLTRARAIAAYFLRRDTILTLAQIGEVLGGKDHSTILYHLKRVEERAFDPTLAKMFKLVDREITKISAKSDY